jgi:hypothetical protein
VIKRPQKRLQIRPGLCNLSDNMKTVPGASHDEIPFYRRAAPGDDRWIAPAGNACGRGSGGAGEPASES